MSASKHRVLISHNYYQLRGGEDESFEVERRLLEQHGHDVREYTRVNSEIADYSLQQLLRLPFRTIWAGDSYKEISKLINSEKPTIAHFNNIFPLISPAAYDACYEMKLPVVQNIRNYRLLCPSAEFFRDHHVCEDCLGWQFAWPSIVHACYRHSRIQTGVVAMMLAYHRFQKTWQEKVDIFIALTEFSRRKLIEGGIPVEKIVVKPNFAYDRGVSENQGSYALFIGRIVEIKGILELLEAWKSCRDVPLKIVGDGPLLSVIHEIVQRENLENVEICGRLSAQKVFAMLDEARFLVFPSLWYEGFPRVIVESYACGRPVVASNIGASAEVVVEGMTGMLFSPDAPDDLAEKISRLWSNRKKCLAMGREARREYENKYTPERNYEILMGIYLQAIEHRRHRNGY